MPDESSSIDLVNSLIEKISLLGDSKVGRGLKDGRCDHNPTLLDAETNEVCDACVRPISTPYYNCRECNLILQKVVRSYPVRYNIHSTHLTRSSSKRRRFSHVMHAVVLTLAFPTVVVVATLILTSSVPPYQPPSDMKLMCTPSILSMTNVMNGAVLVMIFATTTSFAVGIVDSIYTSNVLRCRKHLGTDMMIMPSS